MMIRLLGDLHAKVADYKDLLWKSPYPVIQLGDLDVSGYERWQLPENSKAWFIDGNHDHFPSFEMGTASPISVAPGLFRIPRGLVSGRVLFIGGADSIDRDYRIEGFDWFPEESISERDMLRIRAIPHRSIDVVITHCAPTSIAPFFFPSFIGYGYSGSKSERYLEELWFNHRPRLWIFGHYHENREIERGGCRFVCLAEGRFMDLDIPVNPRDFQQSQQEYEGGWSNGSILQTRKDQENE